MAYQGYSFIFDGVPSQTYGLRIVSFESASYRYEGGSSMEIVRSKAARSLKTKILSATPANPLEFEIEVMCEYELSTAQAVLVKDWLFGHLEYKTFQIMREDLSGYYFNCLFNDPEDIQINGNNGWKFKVICDAGGAWEKPRTLHFVPTSGGTIVVNNQSGNNDYTYPSVSFTLANDATEVVLTNESDNSRQFSFTGLTGGETITIDGDTKIIRSSLGANRLGNFNKKFLRLVRGANIIKVDGNLSSLDITIENFRRLGG